MRSLWIDPKEIQALAEIAARLDPELLTDYIKPSNPHLALNDFNRARLRRRYLPTIGRSNLPFMLR